MRSRGCWSRHAEPLALARARAFARAGRRGTPGTVRGARGENPQSRSERGGVQLEGNVPRRVQRRCAGAGVRHRARSFRTATRSAFLANAEEEQRRKLAGVPTIDEDAYPDREEARRRCVSGRNRSRSRWRRNCGRCATPRRRCRNRAREDRRGRYRGRVQLRAEATAKRLEEQGLEMPRGCVAPERPPGARGARGLLRGEAVGRSGLAREGRSRCAPRRNGKPRRIIGRRAAARREAFRARVGAARKLGEEHPAVVNAGRRRRRTTGGGGGARRRGRQGCSLEEAAGTKVPRGQSEGSCSNSLRGSWRSWR